MPSLLALGCCAVALSCPVAVGCAATAPSADSQRPSEPGLPDRVVPLSISLAPGFTVDCLGTQVGPEWVLSAAHCFSDASASSWILIRDLGASAQVGDIVLHPEAVALADYEPGGFTNLDIVAAHDLALIPLREATGTAEPAVWWRPEEGEAEDSAGVELSYGRRGDGDAVTEFARSEGLVDASELLDGNQLGWLLGAHGRVPHPGDSGGGAFVQGSDGTPRLIGVVQNAPPDGERGRFGLVPLWLPEHSAFIAEVIGTAP